MRALGWGLWVMGVIACTRSSEGTASVGVPTATSTGTATATPTAHLLRSLSASGGQSSEPSTPTPTATATPTSTATAFGPALLHPQTCPPPPTRNVRPPEAAQGCEHCPAGQFCQVYDVRGRTFGSCKKSDCEKDADCKDGLCACHLPNVCYPGNCRTSADCGGRECANDRWRYGHGTGVYCRTDHDECTTHDQCGTGRECAYLGTHWGCRVETRAPPPG